MAKLNEDVKVVMLKGEKGEKGEAGTGIPSGGKTGQAIIKASDNDYDYKWGSLVVNDVANATNDGNGNNIVNTYATKTELNTAKTEASDTYITKTDASDTYLTKTDATSTYLSKTDATSTYLSKTDATVESHKDAIKNAFLDATNKFPLIVKTYSTATFNKTLAAGEMFTYTSGVIANTSNCADLDKYYKLGYQLIGCTFIKISAKTGSGVSTDKVALFYPMVNPVNVQMSGKNLETTNVTITGASIGFVFAHKRLLDKSSAALW